MVRQNKYKGATSYVIPEEIRGFRETDRAELQTVEKLFHIFPQRQAVHMASNETGKDRHDIWGHGFS